MYLLLFLILLLLLIAYLVFQKPLKIFFLLDSDEMEMKALISWLSFLKTEVRIIDMKPFITVYLFNKRIVSKFVKKTGKMDTPTILKALDIHDVRIKTYYGLFKPYFTGIFFAAVNFIESLAEVKSLEQYPEFFPMNEYLKIEVNMDLNPGRTIVDYVRLKSDRSKRRKKIWIRHF